MTIQELARRRVSGRQIARALEVTEGHCQLGVDSARLRLEVVHPRSFSTHTSPHPIRRTPAL